MGQGSGAALKWAEDHRMSQNAHSIESTVTSSPRTGTEDEVTYMLWSSVGALGLQTELKFLNSESRWGAATGGR